MVQREAISQVNAGADILDVNVGLPDLNEIELLPKVVNAVAAVVDTPLSLDSKNPEALKAVLDEYQGKVIINSVSGEEKSLGEAIRAVGPRLKHVHTCENDRGAPGSGNVTWQQVADALAEINYRGPVVIESFTPEVKSIARAAAIWRSLAASSEDLAKDGLKFLKALLN